MGNDAFGSSVVIALAAVLWFVYLIPTWLHRREYLATERNAVRLQQTLRIMAETAEVPREVRAETTARSVAEHQRSVKKEQQLAEAVARARDAAAARAAARRLAETQPEIAAVALTSGAAARRLRRARAVTSLVLLGALVTAGFGVAPIIASGAWELLAVGGSVAVGSLLLLNRMASVARARRELARQLRARTPVVQARDTMPVVAAVAARSGWTPIPVPKPLYLSHPPVIDPVMTDPAEELAAAAAAAEHALRVAEASENVTPIRRAVAVPAAAAGAAAPGPAASASAASASAASASAASAAVASAAPSRFARMGIIDDADRAVTDLDAVLRRRRAVG